MFPWKFSVIFVFRTWKKKFSKMLNYISPSFVEIEIWKFGVIFAILQGIICQSFSLFAFVIREKERFFWEGPRLMDHPVSVALDLNKKKFHFFIDRKKTKYLAKGISGHVFMNIKLEHSEKKKEVCRTIFGSAALTEPFKVLHSSWKTIKGFVQ